MDLGSAPCGVMRSLSSIPHTSIASPTGPVDTYLCALGSQHSRDSVEDALRVVAQLLSRGTISDPREYPWHTLTYPDVIRLRMDLLQHYTAGTAGNYLGRVRRVLRECWRLGLMGRDAME